MELTKCLGPETQYFRETIENVERYRELDNQAASSESSCIPKCRENPVIPTNPFLQLESVGVSDSQYKDFAQNRNSSSNKTDLEEVQIHETHISHEMCKWESQHYY